MSDSTAELPEDFLNFLVSQKRDIKHKVIEIDFDSYPDDMKEWLKSGFHHEEGGGLSFGSSFRRITNTHVRNEEGYDLYLMGETILLETPDGDITFPIEHLRIGSINVVSVFLHNDICWDDATDIIPDEELSNHCEAIEDGLLALEQKTFWWVRDTDDDKDA